MKPTSLSRRDLLRAGGLALAASALPAGLTWRAFAQDVAKPQRTKVLFFTKSSGFQHSVVRRENDQLAYAERVLIDLGKQHGLEVTASKDGTIFDDQYQSYDALVFYTTGDLTKPGTDGTPPLSEQGKQNLLSAIQGGKGFVGLHCASDTFHTPGEPFENQQERDPYIAMVGGEFVRHGAQQEAYMRTVDGQFPGMDRAGKGFTLHEEWYSLKNFAPDLHVLLVNETEGMEGRDYQRPPYPATWARRHGDGRVFYSSMGHREDVWTHPIFQSILMGGLQWALGNVNAEAPANIDEVTPQASQLPAKPK